MEWDEIQNIKQMQTNESGGVLRKLFRSYFAHRKFLINFTLLNKLFISLANNFPIRFIMKYKEHRQEVSKASMLYNEDAFLK